MPGMMSGSVMYRKVCHGVAYRSCATCSKSSRMPSRRAPTVMTTKLRQNVMCAIISVGLPSGMPVCENSTSSDSPMTISGIRMGR